jgi:hypothetical protein
MIYSIYPNKSATLYQEHSTMNTGQDEVVTIEKIVSSSLTSELYNSRALVEFDIDWANLAILGLPTDMTNSASAYLNLYTVDGRALAITDTIDIRATSESWGQGLGRETNLPKTTVGVSWDYKDDTTLWSVSGSSTHSAYSASQILTTEDTDLRFDVLDILSAWSASTINNDGFCIKRSDTFETDGNRRGALQYFSANTHTVYPPRLEICWSDYSNNTGSLAPLDMSDTGAVFFYLKNNRGSYKRGGKIKFDINGRLKYPVKTWANKSAELGIYRVAAQLLHYSIIDCKTEEVIIPYSDPYTNVSVDSTIGNYFEIYSDSLFEERDYRIQLRYRPGISSLNYSYYNIKDTFKIER